MVVDYINLRRYSSHFKPGSVLNFTFRQTPVFRPFHSLLERSGRSCLALGVQVIYRISNGDSFEGVDITTAEKISGGEILKIST